MCEERNVANTEAERSIESLVSSPTMAVGYEWQPVDNTKNIGRLGSSDTGAVVIAVGRE